MSDPWAIAADFSAEVHRKAKIRDLREVIRVARSTCGSCTKWMKSRACPREKNVGGMSRGPSCADPVCSQFEMSAAAARNIESATEQLTELTP